MGGGDLDGFPTLARINTLFASRGAPRPPVVILTGEADPAARDAYLRAGAAAVLLKPCTLESLRQLRALAERGKHGAGGGGGASPTHAGAARAAQEGTKR